METGNGRKDELTPWLNKGKSGFNRVNKGAKDAKKGKMETD